MSDPDRLAPPNAPAPRELDEILAEYLERYVAGEKRPCAYGDLAREARANVERRKARDREAARPSPVADAATARARECCREADAAMAEACARTAREDRRR